MTTPAPTHPDNIDLDKVAATLQAMFNGMAKDVQQEMRDLTDRGYAKVYMRQSAHISQLAEIAAALTQLSAEARARKGTRPFTFDKPK